MNQYWLLLQNGKITGYFAYEFDKSNLSENEKLIPMVTFVPEDYIGLTESEIYLDPLPPPTPDESYLNDPAYQRSVLKKLYYEIEFTAELGEDATALQAQYDALLIEYNDLKP